MNKIDSKVKEGEEETCLIPLATTLNTYAGFLKWENLSENIKENRDILPTMWSEAPESFFLPYPPWRLKRAKNPIPKRRRAINELLPNWETQVAELWKIMAEDNWDCLGAFS